MEASAKAQLQYVALMVFGCKRTLHLACALTVKQRFLPGVLLLFVRETGY